MLMNEEEVARIHKALSAPVRLKILRLIAGRPLCVNAITRLVLISQPAVSQHLSVLRQVDLVRGKKNGYMVHYRLNTEKLREFREAMACFPCNPDAPALDEEGRGQSEQAGQPAAAGEVPR
jgi:ArsR family transcriptional regulator